VGPDGNDFSTARAEATAGLRLGSRHVVPDAPAWPHRRGPSRRTPGRTSRLWRRSGGVERRGKAGRRGGEPRRPFRPVTPDRCHPGPARESHLRIG
jgi:hypothetical protein